MVTETQGSRLKSLEEQMKNLETQLQTAQTENEEQMKQKVEELQQTILQQNQIWDQRFKLLLSKLDTGGKDKGVEQAGSSTEPGRNPSSSETAGTGLTQSPGGVRFPTGFTSSSITAPGPDLGMFGTFGRGPVCWALYFPHTSNISPIVFIDTHTLASTASRTPLHISPSHTSPILPVGPLSPDGDHHWVPGEQQLHTTPVSECRADYFSYRPILWLAKLLTAISYSPLSEYWQV